MRLYALNGYDSITLPFISLASCHNFHAEWVHSGVDLQYNMVLTFTAVCKHSSNYFILFVIRIINKLFQLPKHISVLHVHNVWRCWSVWSALSLSVNPLHLFIPAHFFFPSQLGFTLSHNFSPSFPCPLPLSLSAVFPRGFAPLINVWVCHSSRGLLSYRDRLKVVWGWL